jgi:hypothetical protein
VQFKCPAYREFDPANAEQTWPSEERCCSKVRGLVCACLMHAEPQTDGLRTLPSACRLLRAGTYTPSQHPARALCAPRTASGTQRPPTPPCLMRSSAARCVGQLEQPPRLRSMRVAWHSSDTGGTTLNPEVMFVCPAMLPLRALNRKQRAATCCPSARLACCLHAPSTASLTPQGRWCTRRAQRAAAR